MPRRRAVRRSGRWSAGGTIGRMVSARLRQARRAEQLEAARNILADVGNEAHSRMAAYGTTRFASPYGLPNVNSLYGRGAYSLGKLSRTAMGKSLGRMVSRSLRGIGMYTGRGAYVGNSLMDDKPPQVITTGIDETGAVTVSKLEFLTEVYGPTSAFNVQSFNINPGLESTFPWLSQIAQNYDEYELVQCVFSYRSTTTDIGASTTGQCGTVLMATSYDPAAPVFGDKKQMMAYDGAMSCKTTESQAHGVECDPSKLSGSPGKYVRAFGLDQSKDIKDYDHGVFQLAIANSPTAFANQSLGELWVSYTVKLRKPKFFSSRGLNISRDVFVSGGSESVNFPFGTQALLLRAMCNNINTQLTLGDLSLSSTSAGANYALMNLTFPADYAGVIEIRMSIEGTGLASNFSMSPVGQIVDYADMYGANDGGGLDVPSNTLYANSGTSVVYIKRYRITPAVNGVNNMIIFTKGTWAATTITQASMEIKEINSGFSYKYANIGQSDAPILVNNSGVVTVV